MAKEVKEKKRRFEMPHTLVIMLIILLLASLFTYIIPAGEYDRYENSEGREIVDPESFSRVEQNPVNPLTIPKYIMDGFMESADLIFLILFSGGAFEIITQSGALQALIGKILNRFSSKEVIFIPILTLVFALLTTTQASTTFIGFAPILVMVALAMGFDSIVGVGILLIGGSIGFSTGTLNINTTVVAQEIAGLPLYSGLNYRIFAFIIFYIVSNAYLIKYAIGVKNDPTKSSMYELDKERDLGDVFNSDLPLTLNRILIMVAMFGVLGVIVYGGVKLGWGLKENAVAFLWLGIIAGILAKYKPNKIVSVFLKGSQNMLAAGFTIGFARAVSGIMTGGQILDTSVHSLSLVLNRLPSSLQGIAMFLSNIVINVFITSGSGQATAVMPIFVPLADMVGLTRQTAVLAFNFGDGFCNYILPTASSLMGALGMANVPYDKWIRFMWRLFIIWIVVGSLLMVGAQVINLGPF